MFELFIIGLIVALAISLPVGPIGLLCISQSISRGRRAGLVVGLGATLVDVFYAVVVAYGLVGFISFIRDYVATIHIISIVVLIGLAVYFLKSKTDIHQSHKGSIKDVENFFLAIFLNITNPFVIFSFFTLSALLGIGQKMLEVSPISFVLGVSVGMCLWWYFLCTIASKLESKMNDNTLSALNKGFGILLIAFAVFLIYKLAIILSISGAVI